MRRAEGWPLDRYAVIERAWEGDTVVILGGGPSLTPTQVERTQARRDAEGRPLRVIAINNAYELAPWADVLYFADAAWWEWHRDKEAFKCFRGYKVTIYPSGLRVGDPDVYMLHNVGRECLFSRDPRALSTAGNGGFQAINFAFLAGAARALLLGYDLKTDERGRLNYHNAHQRKGNPAKFREWIHSFNRRAPVIKQAGLEVINCTPGSALACFPRGDIENLLPDPQPALV